MFKCISMYVKVYLDVCLNVSQCMFKCTYIKSISNANKVDLSVENKQQL